MIDVKITEDTIYKISKKGRPLVSAEKRDKAIKVLLSESEEKQLLELIKQRGCNKSQFVRNLILREVKKWILSHYIQPKVA